MNKTFWDKWKVFILGMLGAISISLNQLLASTGKADDFKVYGYAALMAALSYVATQWRGKGITITGVLGTLAGTFLTLQQTGHFTWNQFTIYSVIAIMTAASPAPKSSTYEHNDVIANAKDPLPIGGSKPPVDIIK